MRDLLLWQGEKNGNGHEHSENRKSNRNSD